MDFRFAVGRRSCFGLRRISGAVEWRAPDQEESFFAFPIFDSQGHEPRRSPTRCHVYAIANFRNFAVASVEMCVFPRHYTPTPCPEIAPSASYIEI